jgi:WD40 repeat protein
LAAFNTTLYVQLWHAKSWQLGPRFELHPESPRLEGFGGLSAIDWSPDSRCLAGVSSFGRMCIWDVAQVIEKQRVVASSQAILGVRWSPDGSRLATFATDLELKVWDPTTGRQMMSTQIDDEGALDLRWSADGKRLFARCGGGTDCLNASIGFHRAERGLAP